jgi:hypothetical protein
MKVKDLEQGEGVFTFVSDSQDVQAIRDNVVGTAEYDSYFVRLDGEGDYAEVYGMRGIIPKLDKAVHKIL